MVLLDNPEVTAYARGKLEKAADLAGEEFHWRASFENSASLLAEKYGVTQQWQLIASELVAEGHPVCESKMAAFWAARRFYAPENDGGMAEAAEALEAENAVRGAELDEEEYQFRKDWESSH